MLVDTHGNSDSARGALYERWESAEIAGLEKVLNINKTSHWHQRSSMFDFKRSEHVDYNIMVRRLLNVEKSGEQDKERS